MKRIQINTLKTSVLILVLVFSAGCKKILQEQPRSTYTPVFFQTQTGVQGGITSLYANMRYIYDNGYFYNIEETGTDEVTYAQSADQNFKVMDMTNQGNIDASSSRSDVLWGSSFTDINTASGIIENAVKVGTIPASLIAEARFFRGFDYFMLVQTFGGVPLDLGAGVLKFNTSQVRTSVRNTVPEVYTKAIFPDLLQAVNDLPTAARVTGAVTKNTARLFLAKAYLTYAWWLLNPNNIPTYPATTRTDPAGHDAPYYFQQAYNIAATAISNPAPYGLQPTYYDVHVGSNDRNNEVMLYVEHTQTSELYNGASLSYSNGGTADNFAGWMMQWNYTVIKSATTPAWTSTVNSVQRAADQHLGRPYIRMCPTIGAIENTFADKTNDSRYDGTFTTAYRGNWNLIGTGISPTATLYNANSLPVNPGDAIVSFLNDPTPSVTYPSGAGQSNCGAGTLPGRSDFVIDPEGISRIVYPGLWKLGEYRTDNAGGLGQPNAASTRPFNIAFFSELFFIAAEAAVEGAATSAVSGPYANDGTARGLINVIRARAGKWRFNNNANTTQIQDNSAAMIASTPATIDINYILAERSREYFGAGLRWYDLVRTQKWAELASTYRICGAAYGNHTPATVTRNIQPYLYLRPIPQGQLDAMEGTADQKKAYQNPGY